MIEKPPKTSNKNYIKTVSNLNREDISSVIDKVNEKYEYWNDVKYQKTPDGLSNQELWIYVKLSWLLKQQIVWNKYGINKHHQSNAADVT